MGYVNCKDGHVSREQGDVPSNLDHVLTIVGYAPVPAASGLKNDVVCGAIKCHQHAHTSCNIAWSNPA